MQSPDVHVIERLAEKALAPVGRKTDGCKIQTDQLPVNMPAARRAPGIEIACKNHGAVVLFDHAHGNRQLPPERHETGRKVHRMNIDDKQRFRRPEQRVLGNERRFRGSKQRLAAFEIALPQRHGFTERHNTGRAPPRDIARRKRKTVHQTDGAPRGVMQRGFLKRRNVRGVGVAIKLRCPTRVPALPDVPIDQFDGPGVDGAAGFPRLLAKGGHAVFDIAGNIYRGCDERRLRGPGRPRRAGRQAQRTQRDERCA